MKIIITRIVEATAAAEAKIQLEREGFRVFAVSSPESRLASILPGGGSKKGALGQADFSSLQPTVVRPSTGWYPAVLQAIGLLKTRATSANLRVVLADVEEKIKNGIQLSEAFDSQGIFPKIYSASILSGEKSGALDDVLVRFVEYLKRERWHNAKTSRGLWLTPPSCLGGGFYSYGIPDTPHIVPRMSDLIQGIVCKSHFCRPSLWWCWRYRQESQIITSAGGFYR